MIDTIGEDGIRDDGTVCGALVTAAEAASAAVPSKGSVFAVAMGALGVDAATAARATGASSGSVLTVVLACGAAGVGAGPVLERGNFERATGAATAAGRGVALGGEDGRGGGWGAPVAGLAAGG